MTQKYSQTSGVPLSIAVFLATDHYDHNDDPNTISVTTLIKSTRQIVLSTRVPPGDKVIDLMSMMTSRLGTAIHTGIETAWTDNYQNALKTLGIPDAVIKGVRINPSPEEAKNPDIIPIYMEQRLSQQFGKWTVTGKFDFVGQGRLEDFKSTTAYVVMNKMNEPKFIKQGSIYRMLGPDIITHPNMAIQYIIRDWSAPQARQNEAYPQKPSVERILPLDGINETRSYVVHKLNQLDLYMNAPESDIPFCTDEELQVSAPVYKYYSDAVKADSGGKSSKNFDSPVEAYKHLSEKGKGVVKEFPGEATACRFCAAFSVCSQKDALAAAGRLSI